MTTANQQNHPTQPEFGIQRIYVKDLSFEAPQTPDIFQHEWKPDLNMQLNTNTKPLAEGVYEVVLKVTVTATSDGKTAFLAEVAQAGIFELRMFPAEQVQAVLGTVCPSILFPYAREVVSDLVARGTFPPLYLSPVNFEALYAEHLAKQKAEGTEGAGSQGQTSNKIITH